MLINKGGSSQNGTAENVGEIATYTTTATDRFYNRQYQREYFKRERLFQIASEDFFSYNSPTLLAIAIIFIALTSTRRVANFVAVKQTTT